MSRAVTARSCRCRHLELFDVRHIDVVDETEARVHGGRLRIAVRVDELGPAAEAVARPGADPWPSRS